MQRRRDQRAQALAEPLDDLHALRLERAAAHHDDELVRALENFYGIPQTIEIGPDPLASAQDRRRRLIRVAFRVAFLALHVRRNRQHDRPLLDLRAIKRVPHRGLGVVGRQRLDVAGARGAHQFLLVHVLQRLLFIERRSARVNDERRAVARRGDQRRCDARNSRPVGDARDAHFTGGARPAVGHGDRGAFVARIDDLHARMFGHLGPPRELAVAEQPEYRRCAFLDERVSDRVFSFHGLILSACSLFRLDSHLLDQSRVLDRLGSDEFRELLRRAADRLDFRLQERGPRHRDV